MPRFLIAAALSLLAPAVFAQDRPPMAPSRDVSVTYKVLGQGGGQNVQMSTQAGTGLMRVESPEMGGYAIIDCKKSSTTMVMTQMRMFMEMSAKDSPMGAGMTPDENARYARRNTETVAGVSCVNWEVTSRESTGVACITDDGAMLRYRNSNGDGLEATRVAFAPIPAANFAVPAGFQKMDMPAMGGMPRR
jgi:hypothetical protein